MSFTGVSALAIVLTSAAFAQSAARPEFEVASIRPSVPLGQGHVNVGLHIDGAQVRGISLSLRDYLGMAYRMKISQISGRSGSLPSASIFRLRFRPAAHQPKFRRCCRLFSPTGFR